MTLSDFLKANGLTASKFAVSIGVSGAAISRYINGVRTPRRLVLEKIVKATNGAVGPIDFYGGISVHDGPASRLAGDCKQAVLQSVKA